MNNILYCIKLVDNSDNLDLTWEMLSALDVYFSSFENKEDKSFIHTIYAEDKELQLENLEKINSAIEIWKDFGVNVQTPEMFDLQREDWAEVWKKYFGIIEVSDRLIICPSWLKAPEGDEKIVVTLDPGMSFGTGQHATSFYCLKVIDKLAHTKGIERFLDAGCGSGILTIAAAKLNYQNIDAFDYDPDAVVVAKENLEINNIKNVIPTVEDVSIYKANNGKYDLVCANILAVTLLANKNNISSLVADGKYLALAGILNEEFDKVSEAFSQIGFKEIERESLREWTSGLFIKG